jgi:hypothetical protein
MANVSPGLLLASVMACAHAPTSSSLSPASDEPAPPAAPATPAPTIDPASSTPLDYFVGSWRCKDWLFPDDDTRNGIRIDVARLSAPRPAYAIAYSWSLSTAAGPKCRMTWSATPDRVQFGSASACRFEYRGEGGTWSADELAIHLSEDPPQPRFPEAPRPAPNDVVSSSDPSEQGQLRISRNGTAAFEMMFLPPGPVSCQRI